MHVHDAPVPLLSTAAPSRSKPVQTAVVAMATIGALIFLGLVLAYWTWAWLGPRPEPRAVPLAATDNRAVSAHSLFGSAQPGGTVASPGLTIRLLGVAAAVGGQPGYAVMQLEGRKSIAVREGEEIASGARLAEVHPDHVIVTRNGAREMLAWPKKSGPVKPAAARSPK
jgi:general secretion pathway protein C